MSSNWKTGLFIALLFISGLFLVPGENDAVTRGELGGYFGSDRLYNSSRALSGGMGAGDLDGDGEVEVVFCDFSGIVAMLDPKEDGTFRPVPIWEQEGEPGTKKGLFDLVVADIFPDREGLEIVVGGYTGLVYVLYRNGDFWTDEVIYTMPLDNNGNPKRIFELDIADVDPAAGEEILIGTMLNDQVNVSAGIYPDNFLRYLFRTETGWDMVEIEVIDAVKAIAVGDADPNAPGVEIYVTTSGWIEGGTDSHLVQIYKNGTEWDTRSLFRNTQFLIANVRVGELWSGHAGNELIIAGLSGWCRLLWEEQGEFQRKDIFRAETSAGENSALEGLAIGDFNPLHEGDEAMVTGYYNEVTQIIEVGGEVVADLAWVTDAPDVKLELSGVEVHDISPEHNGNEVLIASLQGWIELLYFENDDLEMVVPSVPIEVEGDSSTQFQIEVIPKGGVSGQMTVDITGGVDVDLIYDRIMNVDFAEKVTVPVVVTPTSGEVRIFDLNISVTVGGVARYSEVTVEVIPTSSSFSIVVEPSSVIMYDKAGNNFNGKVSLAGAESYDQIELSVNSVEGLTVMIDSLIVPGQEKDVIVQVANGFTGSRKLTITGSYNEIPIAQAALFVDVISLEDNLDFRLMENEVGNYYVKAYLNGSAEVKDLTVKVLLDGEIYLTQSLDMGPHSEKDLPPLSLNEGDKGTITIQVTNIAQSPVMTMSLGDVSIKREEDAKVNTSAWIIGSIIVLVAIAVIIGGLFLTKPKNEEPQDMSVESIGGRRKYDYKPPREERPGRRGPHPRREPPRRAPPRRESGPRFR